MITLTIRHVKPAVLRHLQLMAKAHHRSPEDEVRLLLERLASDPAMAIWLARARHPHETLAAWKPGQHADLIREGHELGR